MKTKMVYVVIVGLFLCVRAICRGTLKLDYFVDFGPLCQYLRNCPPEPSIASLDLFGT